MRREYEHVEEHGGDATVVLNKIISRYRASGWELYNANVAPLGASNSYTVSFVFYRDIKP